MNQHPVTMTNLLNLTHTTDRPPVLIPFFSFRIMVGCWVVMLVIAWGGSYLIRKQRFEQNRPWLWATFFSFVLPFAAILTGWFTAEVGRQPWTVYGVLRTAQAVTPFLSAQTALVSLAVFCAVYAFIFAFGVFYIYRLLRTGPEGRLVLPPAAAMPNRPMSVVAGHRLTPHEPHAAAGE
jgi:cytochrome bd ubiquinol oxidase subunit I